MTSRVITQGTVVTQVRWSKEDAEQILIAAALAENPDLTLPDFGEGEGDSVSVQFRDPEDNDVEGTLWGDHEMVLVLTDTENDPVEQPADPEPETDPE